MSWFGDEGFIYEYDGMVITVDDNNGNKKVMITNVAGLMTLILVVDDNDDDNDDYVSDNINVNYDGKNNHNNNELIKIF